MFSDDEVIAAVKAGQVQNFEVLINRYNKKIINFINQMIYDYDEAQNIAQDVFIKVYETLHKYNEEGNFQAFIFTIARNFTLNYIKTAKRIVSFSSFFSQKVEDQYFRYEPTQFNEINQAEKDQQLMSALKELNENQRLALILKIYLNFSYKRIAKITGWSIPKIETLISRAKGSLKNKILLQEKKNEIVNKVRLK